MSIFKRVLQKFKTVYCEDCIYSMPGDKTFYGSPRTQCKKAPLEVDCTSKTDYINRKKKNIVKTYKWCETIRENSSFCFNFSPKKEKTLDK